MTKNKSIAELLIGIFLIFGYLWFLQPIYCLYIKVFSVVIIFSFFILCNIVNKESPKVLGFRWDNWLASSKPLLLFTLVSICFLSYIWQLVFPISNQSYRNPELWSSLLKYIFWGLIQGYIFLGFFFRRYRVIFFDPKNAITLSALTFSLIHIPSPALMIFSFCAGTVWAWVFNKYPNLFITAMSHGILGVFCTQILMVYSIIGPNADIGRWSKLRAPIIGHIDSIDKTSRRTDMKEPMQIYHGINSITIKGWVAGSDKMNPPQINLNGEYYPVIHGCERKDVAEAYNKPEYLHSGFNAVIPVQNLGKGYYKIRLKGSLIGGMTCHCPDYLWIEIY